MTEPRAFFLEHLCNAMEEPCALSTLFAWLVQSVKNELYMFLFDDSQSLSLRHFPLHSNLFLSRRENRSGDKWNISKCNQERKTYSF